MSRRGQRSANPPLEEQLGGINAALRDRSYGSLGLRVVQFMSATQKPRDKIHGSGVKGDPNAIANPVHLKESLLIRDFFRNQGLAYSPAQLWNWIAHTQGLDITAIFHGDKVLGATVGFFWEEELTYLTHLTAVLRKLQGGSGIGRFLREKQIDWLYERLDRKPMQSPPLHAISLSANPNVTNPSGAVGFQTHMFTDVLGWTLSTQGMERVTRLHKAHPELHLDEVLKQDVTPLHFVADQFQDRVEMAPWFGTKPRHLSGGWALCRDGWIRKRL